MAHKVGKLSIIISMFDSLDETRVHTKPLNTGDSNRCKGKPGMADTISDVLWLVGGC
jgi:hypothetical protein